MCSFNAPHRVETCAFWPGFPLNVPLVDAAMPGRGFRYRSGLRQGMQMLAQSLMDLIASTPHHADLVQDVEKLVHARSRGSGCASRQLNGDSFIKHQPARWRCS
jgi:hypothetical protein